ncbi:MAG: hypothetical protein ACJ73L_05945 [Actinomycetes bacterium]
MRGSRLAFAVLWITLVVVVVVSGWIGVHMVGEALAPSAVPVLSDRQMDALIATAKPLVSPTQHGTARPGRTDNPDHTAKPSSQPSPTATGHSTVTSSPTPHPTAGTRAVIRTFRSIGGSALLSCRGPQITLEAVSPAPGYRLDEQVVRSDEVEVKFEGEAGESTIRATCVSGVPVARIDTDD